MSFASIFGPNLGKRIFRMGKNRFFDIAEIETLEIVDGLQDTIMGLEPGAVVSILRARVRDKFTALRKGKPNRLAKMGYVPVGRRS